MTQLFYANKLVDRATRARPLRLSEGEEIKVLSLPLGVRSLFRNKSLPWLSDASISPLGMFHVVRSPFICSSIGFSLHSFVDWVFLHSFIDWVLPSFVCRLERNYLPSMFLSVVLRPVSASRVTT